MIKTYILTTPARNSSLVLRGKTNNSLRYNFTGGDPLTGKSASIMLRSQYAQDLLESSELFVKEPEKTIVEDVKSPEQLIEFVADKLEKVYQRPEAALNFAKSKGYEFPNLELKKKEE